MYRNYMDIAKSLEEIVQHITSEKDISIIMQKLHDCTPILQVIENEITKNEEK